MKDLRWLRRQRHPQRTENWIIHLPCNPSYRRINSMRHDNAASRAELVRWGRTAAEPSAHTEVRGGSDTGMCAKRDRPAIALCERSVADRPHRASLVLDAGSIRRTPVSRINARERRFAVLPKDDRFPLEALSEILFALSLRTGYRNLPALQAKPVRRGDLRRTARRNTIAWGDRISAHIPVSLPPRTSVCADGSAAVLPFVPAWPAALHWRGGSIHAPARRQIEVSR